MKSANQLGGKLHSIFSAKRYHQAPATDQDAQPEELELSDRPAALLQSHFPETPKSPVFSSTDPVNEHNTLLHEEQQSGIEANENIGPVSDAKRPKWIDGIYVCARIGVGVLIINLIFTIVAAVLANRNSGGSFVAAPLYWGDCAVTQRWEFSLHLIINILSTCMLAASNYCMQTLVAPTREEVDASHARGEWLDIGRASMRNLGSIGGYRLGLWMILITTATPFHLLYVDFQNMILFPTHNLGFPGENYLDAFIAPKDLNSSNIHSFTSPALEKCFACPNIQNAVTRDGPSWTAALNWSQVVDEIASGNYERYYGLETCRQVSVQKWRAVVMLSENLTVSDGINASASIYSTNDEYFPATETSTYNSVYAFPFFNTSTGYGASAECFNGPQDSTGGMNDLDWDSPIVTQLWVSECLVIRTGEHCQLLYSPPICIVILIASLIKVSAMFLAARRGHEKSQPLLTCGDAISSFMSQPDPTTKGLCWMSKRDIEKGYWGVSQRRGSNAQPRKLNQQRFWFQAASIGAWIMTLFWCLGIMLIAIILMVSAHPYTEDGSQAEGLSWRSFKEIFSSDTDYDDYATIQTLSQNVHTLTYVVIANCPQLIITISYYWYNSVLTSMLAAAEYSSYGKERKGLRVTWPVKGSNQRSTYNLSVPYRYIAPTLLLYIILHWMVSESFFFIWVIPYSPQNKAEPLFYGSTKAIAYSLVFVLLAVITGAVMTIILCVLAFRRFKSNIPLSGSSSVVISAACHPPKDDALDTAALGLVKWGEVVLPERQLEFTNPIESEVGHCTFTSLDVVTPMLTKLYS
ncbi:hypothetical protein N7493_004350 [Penicillium malachiteum]|uniref:DUF6536 domain-containing protein n=1 Tax=Penicillium malachiteum TaxID=1324776 RepID=A0AAD6HNE3_9EURO|nr:hypothetical protein N7493_004350 [Penicillium malachiteum]